MTPKQQLFLNAYLANPNATQAAIAAGYSEKTAKSQGGRLLTNVAIQEAIRGRVNDAIITADEILNGVKAIALGGKREADQLKAFELLGKHLAMWTEKTITEGSAKIEIEYVNDWRG